MWTFIVDCYGNKDEIEMRKSNTKRLFFRLQSFFLGKRDERKRIIFVCIYPPTKGIYNKITFINYSIVFKQNKFLQTTF